MCACEWDYVCMDHRGTPHDPAYFLEPDPREAEEVARWAGGEESTAQEWRAQG